MLVEIWSDVVCPWCAIGRARFAKALEGFAHRDAVEVAHRSFELDPSAPPLRTGTMAEHLSAKYGMSVDEARKANDHLVEVAALDGLHFAFDEARAGNTFDAHRLVQFAQDHGRGDELLGAFMRGYFGEGLAIGDRSAISEAAVASGLAASEVASVLESDAYSSVVRADEDRARSLGITGVPFFLIDGRFAIPGAQPVERFVMGLDRAWEKITAAPV